MLRNIFSALLLLSTPVVGFGQPSIARLDEATKVFRLDGGNVTYAFGVNSRGELQQLYWGGRLAATDRISSGRTGTRVGVV